MGEGKDSNILANNLKMINHYQFIQFHRAMYIKGGDLPKLNSKFHCLD